MFAAEYLSGIFSKYQKLICTNFFKSENLSYFISGLWNKVLTGIVILQQAHLNSHLVSKLETFLLPQDVNSTKCVALKRLPCLYQPAHGSSSTPPTRPLTYLLTKHGTCTPNHKNTPSASAHPNNKNMTIHTLRAGGGKKEEKKHEHAFYKSSQLERFTNFVHLKTSDGLLVLFHHTSISYSRHFTVIRSAESQAGGQL